MNENILQINGQTIFDPSIYAKKTDLANKADASDLDSKANQSDLTTTNDRVTTLEGQMATKADSSALATKADSSDLTDTNARVTALEQWQGTLNILSVEREAEGEWVINVLAQQ